MLVFLKLQPNLNKNTIVDLKALFIYKTQDQQTTLKSLFSSQQREDHHE